MIFERKLRPSQSHTEHLRSPLGRLGSFALACTMVFSATVIHAEVRVHSTTAADAANVLIDFSPTSASGYQWKKNETGARDLGQSFRSPANARMNAFALAASGTVTPTAANAPFTVTIYQSDSDTSLGNIHSVQHGTFLNATQRNPGWLTFDIDAIELKEGNYYTLMLSWEGSAKSGLQQGFLHSAEGFASGRLWQANNGKAPVSSTENDLAFRVQISELIEDPANPTGIEAHLPQLARFAGVKREGGSPKTWLHLSNASNSERTATVEMQLQGLTLESDTIQWQEQVQLPARTSLDIAIPAEHLMRYGIYQLSYRVRSAGAETPWESDIFCVYPLNEQPASGESAMPIGFATGAPRATPRMLELAASLGFEFYRFNARWARIQPDATSWDWSDIDDYLSLVRAHKMRWHVLSTWSAPWAAPLRSDPPLPQAWYRYVNEMAKRYQNDIEFWEVWNEPDLATFTGTVDDYTRTQRIAYDAIKDANPKLRVTSGGYASLNHWNTKPGAFEAAIGDYPHSFDWFAYHMHDTFAQFYNDINKQLGAIQKRFNALDMPFVFTETGYDTRNGEHFQAETLMKKMSYAAAMGAKGYCWYNLIDRAGRDNPRQMGKTFGLISNPTGTDNFIAIEEEFRPKESFVAAATAIAEIRRLPPQAIWLEDAGIYAFHFGEEGDNLVIGWREDPTLPLPVLVVKNNDASALALDLFGNSFPLATHAGLSLLSLDKPSYFKFTGGTAPEYLGTLLTLKEPVQTAADNTAQITFNVWNPFNQAAIVSPVFAGAEGVQVLSHSDAQTISAGGVASFSAKVAVTPGKLGKHSALYVTPHFDGTTWAPKIEIPIPFNILDASKGASVTLESVTNVNNKQDNDPSTLHLLWGSPVDLSVVADFRTDPQEDSLQMVFTVKDNTLHTALEGEPLLDSDALEIAWIDPATQDIMHLEIAADTGATPRMHLRRNGEGATFQVPPQINITRSDLKQNWNFPYTRYELRLSLSDLGLDNADSIRFNFAVHDNDGEGPKSWIQAATGMGGLHRLSPENFLLLRIR